MKKEKLMKLLRKLMMLSLILSSIIACSTPQRQFQRRIALKQSLTAEDKRILEDNLERSNPSCVEVLDKCAKAVKKQKKAIKEQDDVIKKQEEIIKLQGEEVERSHKATNTAIFGGVSASSFLLLLLLL